MHLNFLLNIVHFFSPLELYSEKLDLYKEVSNEKIAQIEQFQKTSDAQINAIRNKIKAYQDPNKQ